MILVDFSHMFFRYIYTNLQSVQENTDLVAHLLVNGLMNISQDFKASKENPLVVAIDGRRKKGWRTDFFEENSWKFEEYQDIGGYKGHRQRNEEIPWDQVTIVMDDVKKMLDECSDFYIIEHEKAEADDIIYVGTKLCKKAVIISSDKDFKQLINKNIKLYDPIKKTFIKESSPEEFLIKHILTGDRSDNIKPCKLRLGPKTAEKMIHNISGYLETDKQLRERYEFNKKLIDLSEIPSDIEKEIISEYKKKNFNYNPAGILDFCRKYKLREVGKRINILQTI